MKNLIRNFERFCIQHKNKGIPNIMMYIAIGSAVVFVLSLIDPSALLYNLFTFNRAKILQGQVWRLVTFLIAPGYGGSIWNSLFVFLMLFFYYRIGIMLERNMGTLKFNLFYFTGVILMDIAGLVFGWHVTADSLHTSLILAFATLYSEGQVLLFYIIPIKMKYLAWFYLAMTALECIAYRTLLPLVPLVNYLLFFWSDFHSLLPVNWRVKQQRKRESFSHQPKQKPNPNWAAGYQKPPQKPYRHKCTVCGRTDTDYPDLEFRYCSRCSGYHCYCMEHINDHAHIE